MSSETFKVWAKRWLELATWPTDNCTDIEERIEGILKLWSGDIPGEWKRKPDTDLFGAVRDRRKPGEGKIPKKEHVLEIEVLGKSGDPLAPATCLGGDLIDGFNAVKLVRAPKGGDASKVEGDLLLLTKTPEEYRQLLLEVKVDDSQPFYGLVENLRQLKLFQASENANTIFNKRQPELGLPPSVPVSAAVLAPESYYTATGQKSNAVAHCHTLIKEISTDLSPGTHIGLSVWDPAARKIDWF